MSSTDMKNKQGLSSSYHSVVLPAFEAMARGKRSFFPTEPDPKASSYFVAHSNTALVTDIDLDHPAAVLEGLWHDEPELRNIAASLVEIAFQARGAEEESDVSPFIYAMF